MVALQEADSPKCHSDRALKQRQETTGGMGLFNRRRCASRAPDLDTSRRILPRGLEITQEVKRACQRAAGSYH